MKHSTSRFIVKSICFVPVTFVHNISVLNKEEKHLRLARLLKEMFVFHREMYMEMETTNSLCFHMISKDSR